MISLVPIAAPTDEERAQPYLWRFWRHVPERGRDEQLRRFKAREETSYKQHRITEEDWRNREKWDDYRRAVRDMVDRTGTPHAPWTMVSANDKRNARVTILRTIARRLEAEL